MNRIIQDVLATDFYKPGKIRVLDIHAQKSGKCKVTLQFPPSDAFVNGTDFVDVGEIQMGLIQGLHCTIAAVLQNGTPKLPFSYEHYMAHRQSRIHLLESHQFKSRAVPDIPYETTFTLSRMMRVREDTMHRILVTLGNEFMHGRMVCGVPIEQEQKK